MAPSRKPKFLLVDGCPVPYDVAPYVYLVVRRAGQTVSSAYRGTDPAAQPLLRRFGKMNQAQIHKKYPSISNPVGFSEHDLHNDNGTRKPSWGVGVDSGGNDSASKERVTAAGHHYGLVIQHKYPRGVEGHHWSFVHQPRADGKHLTKTRVAITRAMLRAQTAKQMKGHW